MEKKINENKPHDCFVAFLDIMGFKYRLLREGHEKVQKMFESLQPTIELIDKLTKNQLEIERLEGLLKEEFTLDTSLVFPVKFSDSIILISRNESKESIDTLIDYTKFVFYQAFITGIPMKGAIAYGMMTTDHHNSLYFGQPLIDAFELQDILQLYGVIIHHTAEKRFIELKTKEKYKCQDIYRYSVPMKSGKITHYLLDWTLGLFNKNEYKDEDIEPKDIIEYFGSAFYSNVSGKPRIYVDNTIEFLDWIKKEKARPELEKKT